MKRVLACHCGMIPSTLIRLKAPLGFVERLGEAHQTQRHTGFLEYQAGEDEQWNGYQGVFGHAVVGVGAERGEHVRR